MVENPHSVGIRKGQGVEVGSLQNICFCPCCESPLGKNLLR